MKSHFKSNHRLRWAFRICKELGIDDPVHWMNFVSPSILDQWIAFSIIENEVVKEEDKESTPQEALTKIKSMGL